MAAAAMITTQYRVALVTGASGGIGKALVARLCKTGMEVHAVARDEVVLNALAAETGCIAHLVDLSNTEALARLVMPLQIDLLVNNAGAGRPGSLATSDAEDVDVQIDINLRAVMHLARLTLPGMVERNRGHIVNIGSMAGHYNFAGNAAYHATKAAITMLSRQLRYDLFGKRVRVTEISPGRVQTDMFAKALGLDAATARRQFFEGHDVLQPADIADALMYAVGAPSHVNISHIEILPTAQVPGGMRIAKSDG
jgi:NADP-dependent 3-hydroxy acid dehydrogenase YdfG